MIPSVCGLIRWHLFRRPAAPSHPCVLASGHEGMCRDGWGGVFEGTDPRPHALPPEEVDGCNRANCDADEVEPCPASGCALLAGHSGEHMEVDAREWARTKGFDTTTEQVQRDGAALPAEAMAAQVSRLLATPGFPPRAVATLRRADGAFNVLDGLMRNGAPLPGCWRVDEDAEDDEAQHVTDVYDALSEALREDGGAPHSFAALRSA